MGSRQCLVNTRTALYRVFISPAERPEPMRQLSSVLLAQTQSPVTSLAIPRQSQIRCLSNSPKSYKGRPNRPPPNVGRQSPNDNEDLGYDRRFTTKESLERSGRDRLPRDLEITDPQIMVLDNGEMEGPLSTRYVLTKLTPEESLRMIQPFQPATDSKPAEFAICKIVDKKKEYEREKEIKERKKNGGGAAAKPQTKEMELSWGIGSNDLGTKMRHVSGFVKKGMKVEIVIGKKKKGKAATEDEARAVLKKVREEIESCGGKELKPAVGEVGGILRLNVGPK